jgi:hypothetical protein
MEQMLEYILAETKVGQEEMWAEIKPTKPK